MQQHKSHRSANHEVSVIVKLNDKFATPIDWQLRLLQGIGRTLSGGEPTSAAIPTSIVVREVRHNNAVHEPSLVTLVFTNDTLPKDKCPTDAELTALFGPAALSVVALNDAVQPSLTVKAVSARPIGPCAKVETPRPKPAKPTPQMSKNYPPVPRNQVDRVNATIGHLLVFKVPLVSGFDIILNKTIK